MLCFDLPGTTLIRQLNNRGVEVAETTSVKSFEWVRVKKSVVSWVKIPVVENGLVLCFDLPGTTLMRQLNNRGVEVAETTCPCCRIERI